MKLTDHERVALGALLGAANRADADAVAELLAVLDSAAYALPRHRAYHAAIVAAHEAGRGVTADAVLAHLPDATDADTDALIECADAVVGPLTDGLYAARIVAEAARRRDLADRLHRLTEAAGNGEPLADVCDGIRTLAEHAKSMGDAAQRDAAVSFAALAEAHPDLHPPVVAGIIRAGETVNVIAPSKAGKSWLTYDLALSIVTGTPWLGAFPCAAGRVLLIDNELHPPTIAHRIPRVAQARRIGASVYADRLDILSLRGQGVDLHQLGRYIDRIERGRYAAVIADAWYRFIPAGVNENDNAGIMALYNRLDAYAASTAAAWIVVHHASKGNQSEKSITDTGAGAGAQSRAADCHLVLRPHEDEGCVVLDAAVRSFPPVVPLGLRWRFPLWEPAEGLDVAALKGRKSRGEERQKERDADGLAAIRKALIVGPLTVRQVRDAIGAGKDRTERLLSILAAGGEIEPAEHTGRGGAARAYKLTD